MNKDQAIKLLRQTLSQVAAEASSEMKTAINSVLTSTDEPNIVEQITEESINAERYSNLLRLYGPSLASLLHCEQRFIGLEIDEQDVQQKKHAAEYAQRVGRATGAELAGGI